MRASRISVIVADPAWKKSGVALARVKAAAGLALERGADAPDSPPLTLSRLRGICRASAAQRDGRGPQPEMTILLADDERLRGLNAQFRGKKAPTNVLSFPSGEAEGYRGDVAIALGVASREAATAGISLEAHLVHLVVHGVLHLLGYDHVRSREARVMERREIAILDELGISSPYARDSYR